MTYVIGYPGQDAESMLATVEEARRASLECRLTRRSRLPDRL